MGNTGTRIAQPSQISEVINEITSNTIISAVQKNTDDVSATQSIQISCDPSMVKEMVTKKNSCIKNMIGTPGMSVSDTNVLCRPIVNCNAENVSLKSSINLTNAMGQLASIKTSVENNLSDNIRQNMKTTTNLFTDIDSLFQKTEFTQKIGSLNKTVSTNIASIIQNLISSNAIRQTVVSKNYDLQNVSLSDSVTAVKKMLENSSTIQSITNDISNDISQTMVNAPKGLEYYVTMGLNILIVVFVLVLFMITILKGEGVRDAAREVLPYLLFAGGVFLIIELQKRFPPKWIRDNKGMVSMPLFYSSSALMSIILAILLIVFYRYI
jgi:hypothetical protein